MLYRRPPIVKPAKIAPLKRIVVVPYRIKFDLAPENRLNLALYSVNIYSKMTKLFSGRVWEVRGIRT